MVNFKEKDHNKMLLDSIRWFEQKGFDVKKHLDDLVTPFMKDTLKKSMSTGRDYIELIQEIYGRSFFGKYWNDLTNNTFHFLKEQFPDILESILNENAEHLSNLSFYIALNYGTDKK